MSEIITWFNSLSSNDQAIVQVALEVIFFSTLLSIVFGLQRRSLRLTQEHRTQQDIASAMKDQAKEQKAIRVAIEGLLIEQRKTNAKVPTQRSI